jgi:hypothetical protein
VCEHKRYLMWLSDTISPGVTTPSKVLGRVRSCHASSKGSRGGTGGGGGAGAGASSIGGDYWVNYCGGGGGGDPSRLAVLTASTARCCSCRMLSLAGCREIWLNTEILIVLARADGWRWQECVQQCLLCWVSQLVRWTHALGASAVACKQST